jgi:predicted nicotinamide N-methyase
LAASGPAHAAGVLAVDRSPPHHSDSEPAATTGETMEEFRGRKVRVERVEVGGAALELLVPADSDALLDEAGVVARFVEDEYLPYWATLWPAAMMLAEVVGAWPVPTGQPPVVLELGCGVGLAGLVAGRRGYDVILSDYDEDALAFAKENARRNGIIVRTQRVDWREAHAGLRPDRIIAADVLYEPRNLEPVARFIARQLAPGGVALVSDPNRGTAEAFADVARASGLDVTVASIALGCCGAGSVPRGRSFTLRRRSAC